MSKAVDKENESSDSSTQSRYVDADGKEFSAREIIEGFKPTKPYKLKSMEGYITKEPTGKEG